MKQITIYDLLPLLKKGFVAMDKDCRWNWFSKRPECKKFGRWVFSLNSYDDFCALDYSFNIAPFDGDWQDSLIKCGESAIIKKHKEEQ